MARQYAPRTFLRRTPNTQLEQYFTSFAIPIAVDWDTASETDDGPIFEAIEQLSADVVQRINSDFSQIHEMASAKGVAAIVEEATLWNQDWSERFAEMGNDYERAMWTFLHEPRRFAAAGAFHEMDRVNFSWHRFVGHRLEIQTEDDAREVFGATLSAFYRRQGRGRHCHVDVYRRTNPERYCFFAYPEDAAQSELGYDEEGHFQRRSRQSAFEVIFVYRPEEGIVDLYARGNKKQKEALAEIFCMNILGLVGLPDEDGREPFNLSVFKDPTFAFRTDPEDRIQSVDVRLIRLDLPFDSGKGTGRRIMFEAKSTPEAPQAIYGLIREVIDPFQVALADIKIGRAKICITFWPVENERPKTLTFEIGYPDRCTLKDDPHDQIARKYLREWGIARNEEAAVIAEAS